MDGSAKRAPNASSGPAAKGHCDVGRGTDRSRHRLARGRGSGHSLADPARPGGSRGRGGGEGTEKSGARGLGRPPARLPGRSRHLGGRAVQPEVDLNDVHHAPAPRFRALAYEQEDAQRLPAPARRRSPTRRRHQLRLERAERDMHHRNGTFHPRLLRARRRPRRRYCGSPAARADAGRRVELRRHEGATHASVHTTISVLEGLRLYELCGRPAARAAQAAQRSGRGFLLAHRLFRSHRTGAIIKPVFLRFSFPPRWHYDVLRALDHFQAAGAPRDRRLSEAIEIVRAARGADGLWILQNIHRGKTHFELERPGAPSRWNTLRALRVLKWWEGGAKPERVKRAQAGERL